MLSETAAAAKRNVLRELHKVSVRLKAEKRELESQIDSISRVFKMMNEESDEFYEKTAEPKKEEKPRTPCGYQYCSGLARMCEQVWQVLCEIGTVVSGAGLQRDLHKRNIMYSYQDILIALHRGVRIGKVIRPFYQEWRYHFAVMKRKKE
jgi:hypothetical protein